MKHRVTRTPLSYLHSPFRTWTSKRKHASPGFKLAPGRALPTTSRRGKSSSDTSMQVSMPTEPYNGSHGPYTSPGLQQDVAHGRNFIFPLVLKAGFGDWVEQGLWALGASSVGGNYPCDLVPKLSVKRTELTNIALGSRSGMVQVPDI